MSKPSIFVSFDFEEDRQYKSTLELWNANSAFAFTYDDRSDKEAQFDSISAVKNVLSGKINEAAAVVVIVGANANKLHEDHAEIGYRNWQNYEIAKAKEHKKKLIAVQLNSNFPYPDELSNSGATRVYSFTQEAIIKAVRAL